ncbi:MAG: glycosyltransferase [Deltaproteobacteria bacterium]|nr:glycosyltransferase [Deltaproteobacteria bacterium]
MLSVSIVCVTFDRRELVLRCLRSCVEQDYPRLEILVVVNPSGDGTEEDVRREFPTIDVIRMHKNLGFFPALNLAIANTNGDYIMTVDDDAYFLDPHAITRLVNAFEAEPSLGAVTCNLEGPTETAITGGDQYIHVFTTGFTMVPRKVFTEWVGYYPDMFFRSGGETYVCTTLWDMGKRVKRLHNARMYHERAMQGRSTRDWRFHGLRSQILCAIMREPWIVIFPSLLSKWGKSLVQFIRSGCFLTWIHAWFSALFYLPEALRLRRSISWRTQRLLWRLRKTVVSDPASLNQL